MPFPEGGSGHLINITTTLTQIVRNKQALERALHFGVEIFIAVVAVAMASDLLTAES